MDFETLVKTRQSCRDFNGEKVTKEEIDKILEIAKLTPSACNSQPWKVYVALSSEKVKQVAPILQDGRAIIPPKVQWK
jgi:nitroreductase